ncbi:MAG: (deoxy)nucleoside triphosphate pyrophosphohydrolase [Actinomycetes bacterium]|nr:(deoxy)nucleoside triphosphate pyrophosphohydrolase [Actinomycetes bacterium]
MKPTYHVVGAAVVKNGRVLCARRGGQSRSLAGYWEFPGGKVEDGENEREALVREMREECLCDLRVGDRLATTVHEYDFAIIQLSTYLCDLMDGGIDPVATEHSELRWVTPDDLRSLQWAPADTEAVDVLVERLALSS